MSNTTALPIQVPEFENIQLPDGASALLSSSVKEQTVTLCANDGNGNQVTVTVPGEWFATFARRVLDGR